MLKKLLAVIISFLHTVIVIVSALFALHLGMLVTSIILGLLAIVIFICELVIFRNACKLARLTKEEQHKFEKWLKEESCLKRK